jgi:hypothetical protein
MGRVSGIGDSEYLEKGVEVSSSLFAAIFAQRKYTLKGSQDTYPTIVFADVYLICSYPNNCKELHKI